MEFSHFEKGVIDIDNEKTAIIWAILAYSTMMSELTHLFAMTNGLRITPRFSH